MKEIVSKFGTLIIAVIALIQPWVRYLWKKFFKKGKIDIFPSGTIEIGYSLFGPTVAINGTLRCLNQDLFISAMSLIIVKQKDNSTHIFEWGVFRSQKLTHKGEEAEFELPYGFMLTTSFPKRYNIVFVDMETRNEMQTMLQRVRTKWVEFISKEPIPFQDKQVILQKYEEFSKTSIPLEAFSKLDRLCYWEPGYYDLILKTYTSEPNRIFEKRWKFKLLEEEIKAIRLNVVKILQDACIVPSYAQYNFAYAKYEEAQ